MEKKKITYQETYKKGTISINKQQIIDLIKQKDSIVLVNKAGKYDDNKEFITITIDNCTNK